MFSPVLALCLLALVAAFPPVPAFAGAAHAAAADADACNPSQAYPPSPNATVQINTTDPVIGEVVKVSGIDYCPNEDVDITFAGTHVGTGHTDGSGRFDPRVRVPAPAGEQRVCGIGASGLANDRDCLVVDVRAGGSTHQPGTTNGGGTAMTGVEIALLGLLALLLVVAGVAVTTLGRRRRAVRV